MRTLPAVALALLIVLSGCSGFVNPGEQTATPEPTDTQTKEDIGKYDGYTPTTKLDVNTSDGISKSELEKIVSRSMARTEVTRNLNFKSDVEVEMMTRSELKFPSGNASDRTLKQRNVLYESTFIVPEDKNALQVKSELRQGGVTGYYQPSVDKLVVVVGEDQTTIDETTLGHELTHALQDQHSLTGQNYGVRHDSNLAYTAFVEGDTEVSTAKYTDRCASDWDCFEPASSTAGDISNRKFYSKMVFPYIEGTDFVNAQFNDCWCNINEIHDSPPKTTEEIIHPDKYGEAPKKVTVDTTNTNSVQHVTSNIRIGEATIAVMFGGEDIGKQTGISESLLQENGSLDYNIPAAAGWEGDSLVGYTVGDTDELYNAYVWKTQWETQKDATEFRDAYIRLLKYHDAEKTGTNTWVISSGEYNDAYKVVMNDKSVVIYNAENPEELGMLYDTQKQGDE